MRLVFVFVLFIILVGCATKRTSERLNSLASCADQLQQARAERIDIRLSALSVLFSRGCYSEVISLGNEIRTNNRDKYYSILDEASEVLTYEGVTTVYTLDSHERIFLSVLMSVSYQKKGENKSAKIELRKAYDESTAQIYRSGTDEVNVFLQGLMWLQLSGWDKAEPFFNKIESTPEYSQHLKRFVKNLRSERAKKPAQVQVYTINYMPEVIFEWFSVYSKIYEPRLNIKNCISENSIILSTSSWVKQIENRENSENDPVLAAKRVMRLPATFLYSTTVLLVGGALTYASAGTELAVYAGTATLIFTARTFVNGLAPDMRSWRDLPEAFYVAVDAEDPIKNICMHRYPVDKYNVKEFFNFKTQAKDL